jgi:hypothetical protein
LFLSEDFVTERGKDGIAATIDFTWLEFQELFEIVQDSLQQVTPARPMAMDPMELFYMMIYLTSRMTLRRIAV